MAKFLPHVERLEAIAHSASGLLAIAGTRDGQAQSTDVHVVRLPKLEALHALSVQGSVHCLAFSGSTLCAGTDAGSVLFWDTDETGDRSTALASLDASHRGPVRALAVHGSRLASVGADGRLQVHRLDSANAATEFSRELSGRELRAVVWSQDGETLMVGGDDGIARSFAATADSPVREMDMGESVFSLVPLGDGRLVAGCGDGAVRITFLEGAADVEDRAKDAAHRGPVRRLIYTAPLTDSANRELPRRLISVSEDGDVKAWQVDTRRKPPTLSVTSSTATDAVLLPASSRAKAEQRGGTLIVVDRGRTLALTRVDEGGKPGDAVDRVQGRLAELRANLGSKKDEVRIESCKALGELPEDEARSALDAVLLGDKSARVRRAAASAIRDGDRRLSRAALRQALSDRDPDVRVDALAALEHIERETPIAAVRAAADSSHADMRVAAVRRLPPLREASPLVPGLVAELLSDRDAGVRSEALSALFSLEPDAPLSAARTGLAKGPADVRCAVIVHIGVARLALSPEGEELIENGLDDEDESVRSTAILTSIASRPALIAAVRRVDPHTKEAVGRLEAAGTFADAGDATNRTEADLKPLFAAMASRFPDTALRAARLLALLGDARATGALLQLSREPDAAMRRFVVEALMRAATAMPGDARVVDRLRWLIDDPEPTVRQSAFQCLQVLLSAQGAAGELELAALALRAASPDIRVLALPLLVKFGGSGQYAQLEAPEGRTHRERADGLLGDALDDEHDKVRGEAFQTLWAWHSKDPRAVLERGASCRQPEIRRRVIKEIPNQKPEKNPWADALLIKLCGDHVAQVGIDAFDETQRSTKGGEKPESAYRPEIFLAALGSAAPAVRVKALKAAPRSAATELTPRIVELVRDKVPDVHNAAIGALDRLDPKNAEGFAAAFASIFYALRVRAMELCGRRRDSRCVTPAQELLAIPETHFNRPSDELRQRAASALADLGSRGLLDDYTTLLSDGDPIVREMASRGLATACVPGDDDYLVAGLDSEDLPVRSWVAEGLARLGDVRAIPVLAGTLNHDHLPIRRGAMMGFVALGPDGIRGLLSGLEDPREEIQDLAFAVVVARDLALARAGEPPDLLLSALSAKKPELRFAAARLIETRGLDEHERLAAGLAGPAIPERASDMQDWPDENERARRLTVLIDSLASDHPQHRYAAAQVLSLRAKPKAFWRESENLLGPSSRSRPRIPFTSWDAEERTPRKRGWIRSLFAKSSAPAAAASTETERLLQTLGVLGGRTTESGELSDAALAELVFGAYAGLVRQAPPEGEADETHRVRRKATERLTELAKIPTVGLAAVLPVLRRALSDPNHLVRRAAIPAIRGLYPEDSLEPYRLELESAAADVGRSAVDELIARADSSEEARALAKEAINAPSAEVRRHALVQLPRLFEADSIDPWLWALSSRYADLRSTVIDRLMDSSDDRVLEAIGRALESDHEDLRLKAAVALAQRGDARTVDVLAGLLFSDDSSSEACEALVDLAHARKNEDTAAAATAALIARLKNDSDQTADAHSLYDAIQRIGSPSAAEFLVEEITRERTEEEASLRVFGDGELFGFLLPCLRDREAKPRRAADGTTIPSFVNEIALLHARSLVASKNAEIRRMTAERLLRFVPGRDAEQVLESLVQDREEPVRVAACESLAFRAANMDGASVGALSSALRAGRRELVLPAAEGLASQRKPEAFQPLLLVFKAGEQQERERAVGALGALGDERSLEELMPLLDGGNELEPEDAVMVPPIVEALGRMLPHLSDDKATQIRARIENLAMEGEADLRNRALTGLRLAGDEKSRGFIEAIAADPLEDTQARTHAIRELGHFGSPESEQILGAILHEGDYNLGRGALDALQQIFPDEKTRTQLWALGNENSALSGPAASFLSWFGDTETLADRLTAIEDVDIRRMLRQGLIRRGGCPPETIKALLGSDSPGDRADGAWLAGAAKDSGLAAEVERAAELAPDAYRAARVGERADALGHRVERAAEAWLAALWAMGELGAPGARAARDALDLKGAVPGPPAVRTMAARLLDDGDVESLRPLLSDPQADVRRIAADALARGAPDLAPELLTQTTVADGAVMRPVIRAALASGADLISNDTARGLALGTIIGDGNVDALVAAAQRDGKDASRLAAISALGRAGGPRAESVLQALLDNQNQADEVRATTFKALRRLQRKTERKEARA